MPLSDDQHSELLKHSSDGKLYNNGTDVTPPDRWWTMGTDAPPATEPQHGVQYYRATFGNWFIFYAEEK